MPYYAFAGTLARGMFKEIAGDRSSPGSPCLCFIPPPVGQERRSALLPAWSDTLSDPTAGFDQSGSTSALHGDRVPNRSRSTVPTSIWSCLTRHSAGTSRWPALIDFDYQRDSKKVLGGSIIKKENLSDL
jgi:hypothetical protein